MCSEITNRPCPCDGAVAKVEAEDRDMSFKGREKCSTCGSHETRVVCDECGNQVFWSEDTFRTSWFEVTIGDAVGPPYATTHLQHACSVACTVKLWERQPNLLRVNKVGYAPRNG